MAYSKSHYRILTELLLEFNIMALTTCLKSLTTNQIEGTEQYIRSACKLLTWEDVFLLFDSFEL